VLSAVVKVGSSIDFASFAGVFARSDRNVRNSSWWLIRYVAVSPTAAR
jgi:hypothetical protein